MKYPFLVQYRGRKIILVTEFTDGKCSPVIADGVGYCARNFAKNGFNEDYRLYHGEIKVEYKCPPFPFLVRHTLTDVVYFVNEYTNGRYSPSLTYNTYITSHDFTEGMGLFEIYNEEIITERKLALFDNGDVTIDCGKCKFALLHRIDGALFNAIYHLDIAHKSFDGKIKLKMDGDKLISTKIEEEIPEYPFIVEYLDGTLYFVSAATDGKCSPALDNSGRFITRNFKKSGLGNFKIYNGTVILKNRKGE